jgi:hypothetical protein
MMLLAGTNRKAGQRRELPAGLFLVAATLPENALLDALERDTRPRGDWRRPWAAACGNGADATLREARVAEIG